MIDGKAKVDIAYQILVVELAVFEQSTVPEVSRYGRKISENCFRCLRLLTTNV
jgi:hypothetical protein